MPRNNISWSIRSFERLISLELLPKLLERRLDLIDLCKKAGDRFLELLQSFGINGAVRALSGDGCGKGLDIDVAAQKMCEASFLLTGLDRKFYDHGIIAAH